MTFKTQPTFFFVDLENAFMFMGRSVLAQVEHVLRYKREVEPFGNVEVITGTCLYGRAVSLKEIIRVSVLRNLTVIKAMPHNKVWLHELGKGLVLERIVHYRPTNMCIISMTDISDFRREVIRKEFHVYAVVYL